MQIRKLVKAGEASHTISLPKNWLDKNKLKKGDLLYIIEKSDKELVISPELKEEKPELKEITIEIENKSLDTIQREVTSAYINNYNTINIIGKDLYKNAKEIRRILHDFVALEIEEQTSTKIVAKDLLNLKEISIDKNTRRMDIIVRSMILDSINSIDGEDMFESIKQRDYDVNRLYFLMLRLLKKSLKDSKIAEYFHISNAEILSVWYLVLNIESIADICKNLCLLVKKQNLKDLKKIFTDVQKEYLDAIKSYYNKDKKLADKVASNRMNIINECDSFFERNKQLVFSKITDHFKEMENLICNIARIVIDRD